MKNLCVILVLAACGGKAKPEPTVQNTEPTNVKDIEQTSVAEARVIARTGSGGVLELGGDRNKAMKAADEDMTRHCGVNNYTIVQEGEEAVGADTGGSGSGIATAWRVHYQCNH